MGKKATARETALKALVRVEKDDAYLNLTLPPLLQELMPKDRALAVKIATGTVQRRNTLDWSLELYLKRPLSVLTPWIRNLLRLSAYQLLYLDKVPAHAVVDEGVRLARRYGHKGVAGLVNAVLRRLSQSAKDLPWPSKEMDYERFLSLYYSYPDWLVRRWISRYGAEGAEKILSAGNKEPPLSLRPNLLRVTPEALRERLKAEGVETELSPLVPGALYAKPHQAISEIASFQEGLFTIQGESSMLVAPILGPKPEEHILDLCSAPGGKTTHLAELMEDRGVITAVDIYPNRLGLVNSAARRLRLNSIKTLASDGMMIDRAGLPSQDRILVDAPCSGFGVVRRLPELKWRRREEDQLEMQHRQLSLLKAASVLLKPGGYLLYSVCTNEPEETIEVVGSFKESHPNFNLQPAANSLPPSLSNTAADKAVELLPHIHGLDGFFIALWRKS